MPAQVSCPGCRAVLQLPEQQLNQNIRCGKCQRVFYAAAQGPLLPETAGIRPAVAAMPAGPASMQGQPPPSASPAPGSRLAELANRPLSLVKNSRQWVVVALVGGAVLLTCGGFGTWMLVRAFRGPESVARGSTGSQASVSPRSSPSLAAAVDRKPEDRKPEELGPFTAKADAKPEDFLGRWSGKWDNTWRVQFTIAQDRQTRQLLVAYEWEETLGRPFWRQDHKATPVAGSLRLPAITISISARDPNRGLAVGHFANQRMAYLVREKGVFTLPPIDQGVTLEGHTQAVYGVAFSPDGKRLVSCSGDNQVPGEIKIWDVGTGKETLSFKGHTSFIYCVAFSPDGKRLVSSSMDNTIKVWDAATGKESLSLTGHTNWVGCVAFSPDGKRIVSASHDRTARVWDAATGKEILSFTGHKDDVYGVAFSPDGRQIVSSSDDNTVKVWDAATGKETLSFKAERVSHVAFSPDAKRIVGTGPGFEAKVWDAGTGKETLTLKGHLLGVICVAFSPDGKQIASGSWDNTVRIWSADTGKEILTHRGHTGRVHGVAFSPDGKRIASGSTDRLVKVWDVSK